MRKFKIKKVVIIGSGIMGSRIACYLSDVGLSVNLLDIPGDKNNRNKIVTKNFIKTTKSRPEPLLDLNQDHNINLGNIEDDTNKIKESDWIIEVVSENINIKRKVFDIIEKNRSKKSIVSTNTSGISINKLCQGRSKKFKEMFLGTHFFNPPRQLRLLEIIPNKNTRKDLVDFLIKYSEKTLGKEVVKCKDTPGFIGNRVGIFSLMSCVHNSLKFNLSVSETDYLTGNIIGRPKSGTYRTIDIIGLDTLHNINKDFVENIKHKRSKETYSFPQQIQKMYEKGFWGEKTKKGFYKKETDKNGKKLFMEIDTNKLSFFKTESIKNKNIYEGFSPDKLLEINNKHGEFYKKVFFDLFSYCSIIIPEISKEIYKIDKTLRYGFGWNIGPFALWQELGIKKVCRMMKKENYEIGGWLKELIKKEKPSFFEVVENKKTCYNLKTKKISLGTNEPQLINLNIVSKKTIINTKKTKLSDVQDEIALLEIKENITTKETIEELLKAIKHAEKNFSGLIIRLSNNKTPFGAFLGEHFRDIVNKDKKKIEETIKLTQELNFKIKTCSIPTVCLVSGFVVGPNLGLALHSNQRSCYIESYLGVVELGFGLVPIGGITNELLVKLDQEKAPGDPENNRLSFLHENFTFKKISSSARVAKRNGLLDSREGLVFNPKKTILDAKDKIKQLNKKGFVSNLTNTKVTARGSQSLALLYTQTENLKESGFLSNHDKYVSDMYSYLLCGGEVSEQVKVDESYFLNLEKDVYMEVCSEPKTIERVEHFIKHKKVLRN